VVDLTKPCVKCGAVNRNKSGNCKPCQKQRAAKYRQSDKGRAQIRAYLQSDEGRAKEQKYRQSDKRRAKQRAYRQSDEVRAKKRAYRQSDEVRAKELEQRRKRRESATGYQKIYTASLKYKKKLFEFSLQNQQKVIEQCQQKLTQPNEIS
jgi:hypothetical protein